MVDSLGFVVHPEKSVFEPVQIIDFLGFTINTIDKTVTLTDTKKHAIFSLCSEVLSKSNKMSTRYLSRTLGKFSSCFFWLYLMENYVIEP